MSLILDALRSKATDGKGEPPAKLREGGEGLRTSGGNFLAPTNPLFSKRNLLLGGGLLLALLFSVGLRWLLSSADEVVALPGVQPKTFAAGGVATGTVPVGDIPVTKTVEENGRELVVAETLLRNNDLDGSLKIYRARIDAGEKRADVFNNIGLIYLRKGVFTSAGDYFTQALEIDDHCASCFNNLGLLKTRLEEIIEAEKYFRRAAEIDPSYADPWFNLGVLYEKNGNIGQAVAAYREFASKAGEGQNETATAVRNRIRALSGK